jgi:ABC-type Na+ efflux pump permease subunit
MSAATKLNWFFLVGAAGCSLAGILNFVLHQLLAAGGYLFIGAYLSLAAVGALEAKGTGKYRLASLFALIGGLLCFASFLLWALARRG